MPWRPSSQPDRNAHCQDNYTRNEKQQCTPRNASGLGGWRPWGRSYSDSFLSPETYCSVQQESMTAIIIPRRFGLKTSLREYDWDRSREALSQLDGSLCCNQGRKIRSIPSTNNGWHTTTPPLEYNKFKELLSINESCISFAQTTTSWTIFNA